MLWWKKLRLTVGSSDARVEAIKTLASSGDPGAIDLLLEAFQDRDGQVPVKAAEALGKLGNPRAVPPLVAALKDKDDYIRWAAAAALAMIGKASVDPLVTALRDPAPAIRDLAIRTLGEIGAVAVPPLSSALRNPHKFMRETAAEALGGIRDEKSVIALIGALGDREQVVREKAAQGVVKIGRMAVPALLAALNHANPEVRKHAEWAVEKIGREPMTETYVRPIAHGKWKDMTDLTAAALDPIVATLQDASKEKRFTAVRTLANVGDERAVSGLILALGDAEREVRDAAIHALVKIRAAAVEPLLAVLAGTAPAMRPRAVSVLGYIGDPRACGPLLAAMKDADGAVRAAAAEALAGYKKDRRMEAPLLEALKDDDVRVRYNAVGALCQISDSPATIAGLRAVLDDTDEATRRRAVQGLGNIGDESVIEPLVALFAKDPAVRSHAALAVAKIKPPRSVPLLLAVACADLTTADDTVEILTEVVEVAATEITPEDLKAVAGLPQALEAARAGNQSTGLVKQAAVDASKVAGLAADELVRRGLLTREKAIAAVRGSADSRLCPRRAAKSVDVFLLHGMHQPNPEMGNVLDLSDGGLGVLTHKKYEPGTMLSLRPASASDELPWVLVEVRHCRQAGRQWRIGCKFVRSPSYGVMVLFG